MSLAEKLDNTVKTMVEFSDPDGINIEWYEDRETFHRYQWSMVRNHDYRKGREIKVTEGVETLLASILDLRDEKALKIFRDTGSKPSYMNTGLWKLKKIIDSGEYSHIFVYGIGELDEEETKEFIEWISKRV